MQIADDALLQLGWADGKPVADPLDVCVVPWGRCSCLVIGLGEGLDAEGKKSNQTKVSYHFTLIKIFYKIKIILAAVLSF